MLTAETRIRVKAPLPLPQNATRLALTGDTKIRLSQIVDLAQDKTCGKGTVHRWKSDGKLHEKTAHGWRLLNTEYEPRENESESKKNEKKERPKKIISQKDYDEFIDNMFNGTIPKDQTVVRLPAMKPKLMEKLGLDKNANFLFDTRYKHVGPVRKAKEGQDLRKEEYKLIPTVIKKANRAILEKNGNFRIVFRDFQNPDKLNKLIFSKLDDGNCIINISKVDKLNAYHKKINRTVGEGVAPSI